jgi:hypothetical protein
MDTGGCSRVGLQLDPLPHVPLLIHNSTHPPPLEMAMGPVLRFPAGNLSNGNQGWGKLAPHRDTNEEKSLPIGSIGFEDVPPVLVPETRVPAQLNLEGPSSISSSSSKKYILQVLTANPNFLLSTLDPATTVYLSCSFSGSQSWAHDRETMRVTTIPVYCGSVGRAGPQLSGGCHRGHAFP